LEIKTNPNGKIQFRLQYFISPHEAEGHWRRRYKVICCHWIQAFRSNGGSPASFVQKRDYTLQMCNDYRAVNAITVKDHYPLPHIEDLLNCIHGSCWFTKLDMVAGYHQTHIATTNRQKTTFTNKFG
jgi:hypothetical protein